MSPWGKAFLSTAPIDLDGYFRCYSPVEYRVWFETLFYMSRLPEWVSRG